MKENVPFLSAMRTLRPSSKHCIPPTPVFNLL